MTTTLDPHLDSRRLRSLKDRVLRCLRRADGPMSLGELQYHCGGSEAGISARLRELRKSGHRIKKKRVNSSGLWVYWIVEPGRLF